MDYQKIQIEHMEKQGYNYCHRDGSGKRVIMEKWNNPIDMIRINQDGRVERLQQPQL